LTLSKVEDRKENKIYVCDVKLRERNRNIEEEDD
jgi:hypothetical protein